jgi:hypothetical protein
MYDMIGLVDENFLGGLIVRRVLESSSKPKSKVDRLRREYDAGFKKFTDITSAYAADTPPMPRAIMLYDGSWSPRPYLEYGEFSVCAFRIPVASSVRIAKSLIFLHIVELADGIQTFKD